MKVKILRTIRGQEGMLYKNHLREVSDEYGKELVKKEFAVDVTNKEKETTIEIEELEANVEVPRELKDFTVTELKGIAKEKGLTGYSNMKKQELINEILGTKKIGKSLDEVEKVDDFPKIEK